MKAILIENIGRNGRLCLGEIPEPVPDRREVLVRVRATGLNRADLLQCKGLYPPPPGFRPDLPGLEFAGSVLETGGEVLHLERGDRVMGILGGEGHAEQVAVHETNCMPVPENLDWASAAAIPEAFLTAWDALFRKAGLESGETVLIHAAGSGVGTAAVQLAAAAGCRVVALCRSSAKREKVRSLGADDVYDPADPDLRDRILNRTAGRGVDVVMDMVGGPVFRLNSSLLATCGRWVLVGLLGGSRAEVDLADLLTRRITLAGTVLRSRSVKEKGNLAEKFTNRVLPMFSAGKLRPVLHGTFTMDRIRDALEVMERNENFGKIVMLTDRW
jgi:putative PIG3 family NAD(P)H quinone oxidoreductase